jgi:hypothetical protein
MTPESYIGQAADDKREALSKLRETLIKNLPSGPKHSKTKLDMGKSCIRFKKPDAIPFDLIAELASKITVDKWIERYETNLKR